MKRHTAVYMGFFGYKIPEDCFCEICGSQGKDIHHVEARGMGGSKLKDRIENLMCVCRNCHEVYGDVTELKITLKKVHLNFMKNNGLKSELAKLNPSIDEQKNQLEK